MEIDFHFLFFDKFTLLKNIILTSFMVFLELDKEKEKIMFYSNISKLKK